AAASCRGHSRDGGEICQGEESGLNFLYQLSVRLRLVTHFLPFRIIAKSLPVAGSSIPTGMSDNIEESLAFQWIIERRPVRKILDAVFLEQPRRVIPKTL